MTILCPLHIDEKTNEKRPAIAVCHHCGKPLCSLIDLCEPINVAQQTKTIFCGYTINDPFFYQDQYIFKQPEKAHHCEQCLISYHRNYRVTVLRLKKQYDRI